MKKIKYAVAGFDNGEVKDDTIEWREGYFLGACNYVEHLGSGMCGIFYYGDIKDEITQTFFDSQMNATREQFEADPSLYGICYYKQTFVGGKWVLE